MTTDVVKKCRKCGGGLSPRAIRCPSCGKLSGRGEKVFSFLVISLIILSVISFIILSESPSQDPANLTNRQTGLGKNDFWVTYPSSRSDQNSAVPHPAWVIAALDQGPVMIFAHIEDCMACAVQAPTCSEVNRSHNGNITYFDLLGGRDDVALNDALNAYDPSGGSQLVPLVVVINEIRDANGNSLIVWHSWEGIVSLSLLDSWVNDALAHHDVGP
jgi:hypothetical protein